MNDKTNTPVVYADNFSVGFSATDGELEIMFRDKTIMKVVMSHVVFVAIADIMKSASNDMKRALGNSSVSLEEATARVREFSERKSNMN